MASKLYKITHPDGSVERTSNMSAFCKKHGLSSKSMSRVANGISSHHKSYTAKIVSSPENGKLEILEKRKNSKIIETYDRLVKTPYAKLTLEQKNDFILTMYAINKVFTTKGV